MNTSKRLINQVQKNYIESKATGYRIAKDTGIAPDTIYAFLRGERFLDIDNLERVCKYLNITLAAFFDMDESATENSTSQITTTHLSKK